MTHVFQIHATHIKALIADNLGRRKFIDLIDQLALGVHFCDIIVAGGNIRKGNPIFICQVDNTHNVIVFGFIQCLDIHICSGRYNTDDLSFYNSFCKLWIFHLLTDCHFMSIGYQTV